MCYIHFHLLEKTSLQNLYKCHAFFALIRIAHHFKNILYMQIYCINISINSNLTSVFTITGKSAPPNTL